MSDTPKVNNGPTGPQPADPSKGSSNQKSGKEWNPKPFTWLGMHFDSKESKQLWTIICQVISTQISHDKDKALKAMKKLKSDEGDSDS